MNGITAPFDPAMNLEIGQTYSKRQSIYRERNVIIEISAEVKDSSIATGSIVGNDATVLNSVIGRHVTISDKAVIIDSIIWDDVVVGESAKVNASIVTNANNINGELGPKVVLPLGFELQLPVPTPTTLNGAFTVYDGDGNVVQNDDEVDEEDNDIPMSQSHQEPTLTLGTLNITDTEISDIGSDSEDEDDSFSRRRRRSSASGFSDIGNNDEFYKEAEESLTRAFLENHSIENATIELKTLRMATNVTFHEIREAIVSAFLDVYLSSPGKAEAIFKRWHGLLSKFEEDEEAEMDTLLVTQRMYSEKIREGSASRNNFKGLLRVMYMGDVVEEETFYRWYESERAKGVGEKWGEDMATLRRSATSFMDWLENAEEESEDST